MVFKLRFMTKTKEERRTLFLIVDLGNWLNIALRAVLQAFGGPPKLGAS
jgi:hypothetical protein